MSQYELMMVMDPEIDDDQVEGMQERVRTFVAERDGQLTGEDHWGRRKLAFRIGKFSEGNYFVAQLELEPAPAKELEGTLNMAENVLRYLLVLRKR